MLATSTTHVNFGPYVESWILNNDKWQGDPVLALELVWSLGIRIQNPVEPAIPND
jgi:hypothetical protein